MVATSDAYAKPDYLILRRRGNRAETLPADEDDLLQPGDVVRVQPRLAAPGPSAAAGTGGPRVLAGQASDE